LNIISLFDGMSCGQIALNRIGIKPGSYYASEVDKHAIKVTMANYPDTIQLGDVTKWREWDIDWAGIDLLIGGSPCQGFSFAGKQLAFDDSRSKLFFVYVDILNHIRSVNPEVKFMLENVKMKKEHMDVISEYLGVQPVFINSALVSAQNRQRFYWANWEISQPENKGVFVKDIVDLCEASRDPSWASISRKSKNGLIQIGYYSANSQGQRLYSSEGKHPTLSAVTTGGSVLPFVRHGNFIGKATTKMLCRLQTVPENYFNGFSHGLASRCLGNGWTVDVIVHIFKSMPA